MLLENHERLSYVRYKRVWGFGAERQQALEHVLDCELVAYDRAQPGACESFQLGRLRFYLLLALLRFRGCERSWPAREYRGIVPNALGDDMQQIL